MPHISLRLSRRYFQTRCPILDLKCSKQLEFTNWEDAVKKVVDGELKETFSLAEWPLNEKLLLTSPKSMLIDDVKMALSRLVKKSYIGTSGNASRLVYGEKGIGKSSAFIFAITAAWLYYPNVVPIYLEYSGKSDDYLTPSDVLAEVLGLPRPSKLSDCIKELRYTGKFALIVADEIDQVYTGMDNNVKRRAVLDELGELGCQMSGRTYTYLCGSSFVIPSLISKSALSDTLLMSYYPFVKDAPNLNGHKFRGLRVHRGMFVQEDFEILQNIYKISPGACNLVCYQCGTNLREINEFMNALTTVKHNEISEIMKLLQNNPPVNINQRSELPDEYKHLIDMFTDKLVEINYNTLKCAAGGINETSTINWMNLEPLTRNQLQDICIKLKIQKWESVVNLLVDAGYLSAPPDLAALRPSRPSQLMEYFPRYIRWKRTYKFLSHIPWLDKYFKIILTSPPVQVLLAEIVKKVMSELK